MRDGGGGQKEVEDWDCDIGDGDSRGMPTGGWSKVVISLYFTTFVVPPRDKIWERNGRSTRLSAMMEPSWGKLPTDKSRQRLA